jgi:serine/threonine-protein kinase
VPLPLLEVLNISIQTADALSAAHEAGIVHRDIKPENIMVRRRDGYVKVLDFGLAKLTESAVDSEAPTRAHVKTSAGVVMGTPSYMSPEQARGEQVDARTDLWSLGVVLYELVAGCVPFGRSNPSEVIALILEREPPPLARYAREVPAELERIVSKALTKSRDDRYQTAKDLLVDLRRLRQQLEVDAGIERSAQPVQGKAAPTSGVSTAGADAVGAGDAAGSSVSVKHITLPRRGALIALAVCVLLALGTAAYFGYSHYAAARRTGTLRTLAVLPFENRTNDGESKYLCEGISESLINSLSQLPGVTVRARNSSFKYEGGDPLKAARDLDVDAVLTGRVLRLGDHLVISVELVNARDNIQEWGERYDRKRDDVFRLESEISREIAEKLRLQLTASTKRQLERASTVSPLASDLLWKGRYLWRSNKLEDQKRAVEIFKEATATDPSFALAYAELGGKYEILFAGGNLDPKEFRPKAEAAVKRALELDENLADAHYALANLRKDDWDWAAAEREYKRALELDPNLAEAHTSYYFFLIAQQRFDEAIAHAKRASELDPFSIFKSAQVGNSLAAARRYTEAIASLKKTVEMDPSSPVPHFGLGYVYTVQGRYGDGIAAYEEMIRLGAKDLSSQIYLGAAYARAGERDKASAILKRLETSKEYVSPTELSLLYVALGDREQAFRLLDKAYAAHDLQLGNIGVDASYDDIRDDSRFKELLRRVGLPG